LTFAVLGTMRGAQPFNQSPVLTVTQISIKK